MPQKKGKNKLLRGLCDFVGILRLKNKAKILKAQHNKNTLI